MMKAVEIAEQKILDDENVIDIEDYFDKDDMARRGHSFYTMKYIVNPVTGDYESTSFTFRDRFALGGGVIQGEKVGSRENFAKPIIKPFAVSQAVVDKIDLDDVKRLRSKGFTVEKIANKYKISKGAMERIINANKNYFTKLTPADKLSKERLNALNKVTNFFYSW